MKKRRDEWKQMKIIDDMHTLLASDCMRAGDKARAEWHIATRNHARQQIEAAASLFCGRKVTGYV